MATLTTLIQRAQRKSDNENSGFINNTAAITGEWTQLINEAYAEVYGLVVQAFSGDYYVTTPPYSFTTDGINDHFALPSDFFKLLGVDVLYGAANQYVALKPFNFADRNRFSWTNQTIPAAGQTVRMFYVPKFTPLAIGTDTTVDLQNDWEELIVVSAAIQALIKEESDVSALEATKMQLIKRINEEAENRDAGNPVRMVDSRGRGAPMMAYRLDGSKLWLIGQRVVWPFYGDGDGWGYADGWF